MLYCARQIYLHILAVKLLLFRFFCFAEAKSYSQIEIFSTIYAFDLQAIREWNIMLRTMFYWQQSSNFFLSMSCNFCIRFRFNVKWITSHCVFYSIIHSPMSLYWYEFRWFCDGLMIFSGCFVISVIFCRCCCCLLFLFAVVVAGFLGVLYADLVFLVSFSHLSLIHLMLSLWFLLCARNRLRWGFACFKNCILAGVNIWNIQKPYGLQHGAWTRWRDEKDVVRLWNGHKSWLWRIERNGIEQNKLPKI